MDSTINIDLHLHTNKSDGTLSPSEIVELSFSKGLKIIAITDHDTTNGINEAYDVIANYSEMTLIPGIELSVDIPGGEIHLLGYFIDIHDESFQQKIEEFRLSRVNRAKVIVEKLNHLGLSISWNEVTEVAQDAAIGRPHIAQVLVNKNYIKYPKEAFDRYIGRLGPAYADRPKLSAEEAIKILLDNGAVPVLAHPFFMFTKKNTSNTSQIKTIIKQLQSYGLMGIETYYGKHGPNEVSYLKNLCKELNLIPTGGSDFHNSGNPNEPKPGDAGPPMSTYTKLKELHLDIKQKK